MSLILVIIKLSWKLITHSEIDVLSDQSSDFLITVFKIFRASNWKGLWKNLFSVQFQTVDYIPTTIFAKDFTKGVFFKNFVFAASQWKYPWIFVAHK